MTNYVYVKSEQGLWTVGFYTYDGRWISSSDYENRCDAADRVATLNGNNSGADACRCRVLETALRDLVDRCDGAEGVRADGSNIDTRGAHAALGDFEEEAALHKPRA